MDFPVESYSFLPGSRAILDLSYRSRLRLVSQQSRPTMSMVKTLACEVGERVHHYVMLGKKCIRGALVVHQSRVFLGEFPQ